MTKHPAIGRVKKYPSGTLFLRLVCSGGIWLYCFFLGILEPRMKITEAIVFPMAMPMYWGKKLDQDALLLQR